AVTAHGFYAVSPVLALIAWARAFGAARGTAARSAPLGARASGGGKAPAAATFAAPLAGRNTLTLTVRVPPQAAISLTAISRLGAFARASATFRAELQGRAGAQSAGQTGSRFPANLAGRGTTGVVAAGMIGAISQFAAAGRVLALAAARAAITLLSPPPPAPSEEINPYYEIDC
ncbi:MAG: hypothetical protein ACREE1_17335, partial [Stellaceae bacterium]